MNPVGQPGHLLVRQKITPVANRYWIHQSDPGAGLGPVIAYAAQKRLKLKEEIRFFSQEDNGQLLFEMRSRQIIDLHATTDILDPAGTPIGTFTKDAMASLVKSTWHLEGPGYAATGTERSTGVALTRRFGGMVPILGDVLEAIPWQFHFDFRLPDDTVLFSSERQLKLRDQYLLTCYPVLGGQPLDWRVAAAMGVALDAFQGR